MPICAQSDDWLCGFQKSAWKVIGRHKGTFLDGGSNALTALPKPKYVGLLFTPSQTRDRLDFPTCTKRQLPLHRKNLMCKSLLPHREIICSVPTIARVSWLR